MKFRPVLKKMVMVVICIAAFSGCSNFHEVTPGNLYRSGQLSKKQFDHYVKKYGIKTVINLRGASLGSKWYDEEMDIMRKHSVHHIDIKLSARIYVSPEKIDSIMNVTADLTRPLLVHCQGGADRTGLFCASWRLKNEKDSVEKASKQLSFIYWHIPHLIWKKTVAMDSSFNDYIHYLDKQKFESFSN